MISKRSILSPIARQYDPLGLVITKAKIFMQQLSKQQWDESTPQTFDSSWLEYVLTLNARIEIHCFCDENLSGYGACICICSEHNVF